MCTVLCSNVQYADHWFANVFILTIQAPTYDCVVFVVQLLLVLLLTQRRFGTALQY